MRFAAPCQHFRDRWYWLVVFKLHSTTPLNGTNNREVSANSATWQQRFWVWSTPYRVWTTPIHTLLCTWKIKLFKLSIQFLQKNVKKESLICLPFAGAQSICCAPYSPNSNRAADDRAVD